MIQWTHGKGRAVLAVVAICLGTAPAGAEITSPDRIALPLTVEQLLVLEARVSSSDPFSGTGFSVALSDDGTTALVGAPFESCSAGSRCGAVRVLVRSGEIWTELPPLTPLNRAAGAEFGTSVALSGDGSIALVGALRADCPTAVSCGTAYVFVRNGQSWSQAQELFASDAKVSGFFGISVDLSVDGSIALVGASLSSCGGQIANCGAAYVFQRTGGSWIETARLAPSMPVGGDLFGQAVSLSDDGTLALIGAPFSGQQFSNGEAYVFVRSGATWTEERRITASDAAPIDQFGTSVSLSSDGSVALVGAISDDCAAGDQCGAVYVLARNGGLWTETAKLTSSDNSGNDFFGIGTALAGDARHALIGAFGACQAGPCRVAYLFVEEDGLWREKQQLSVTRCSGQFLGSAVALSENADHAAVGVHTSTCLPGEAYLFGPVPLPLDIPVANGTGLAILAIALAAVGLAVLRH